MKPNKQKTDWDIEFDKHWEFHDSECPIGLTGGGDCKCSVPDIKDFISQLLKTQRQQLISEIEGIVGEDEKLHRMFWDSDIVNVEVKIRNELRKQIRERLKQIK